MTKTDDPVAKYDEVQSSRFIKAVRELGAEACDIAFLTATGLILVLLAGRADLVGCAR